MGREILFRGKRIDNREWIVGLPTIMWGQPHIMPFENENTAYPYEAETLCQYTGLIDKNGRKIFEGDIVKCGCALVVTWNEKFASWCLTKEGWMHNHFFGESCDPEDCEIIGNRWDNPELLRKRNLGG